MSYVIKLGSSLIMDMRDPERCVGAPSLAQEINQPGSLEFTIYPTHPKYNDIVKLQSVLSVYRDGALIFEGRVLEDSQDVDRAKKIYCEGVLGYLMDSQIRPFSFSGTPAQLFTQFITEHNAQVNASQRFTVGNVTVTDPNDYIARSSENYISAWEAIKTRLLDTHGGYVSIRYAGGVRYLDYLADFTDTSTQRIVYGENLATLLHSQSAQKTYTAIIPLGAKIENPDGDGDVRITISSVNDDKDYLIDTDAAALYGVIYAPASDTTWDDVTLPANLKTKGLAYLTGTANKLADTITLTAADLHGLDSSVEEWQFCDYVVASSPLHGISDSYLIRKLTMQLDDPGQKTVTLSGAKASQIDAELADARDTKVRVETIEADYVTRAQASAIASETIDNNTSILQSAEQIILTALQSYTKTQDFTAFQSSVQTALTVMAGQVELKFTTATSQIETLGSSTTQQFETISKYIRFVDGAIVLGTGASQIKLKLMNDKLFFFAGADATTDVSTAFAYFSASKLYVRDANILSSIQIGSFAFVPRANGNLAVKKVT